MRHPCGETAVLDSEATDAGVQLLMPGVPVVSLRTRLEFLMAQPLVSRKPQKPLDIGLFDEAALNQLSLF